MEADAEGGIERGTEKGAQDPGLQGVGNHADEADREDTGRGREGSGDIAGNGIDHAEDPGQEEARWEVEAGSVQLWAGAHAMRVLWSGRGGKAEAPDVIGAGKEAQMKAFTNESEFDQAYEKFLADLPQAGNAIRNRHAMMENCFRDYLDAFEKWVFRHAYEAGYAAALAGAESTGGHDSSVRRN